MYDDIDYTAEEGIATVTISRPDAYNAFTQNTIGELNEALETATNDDRVHIVVLTGEGDGFCAGADVTTMPDWSELTKAEYGAYLWQVQSIVRHLRGMDEVTIAAVNGPAIGAGCDFALACDLRTIDTNGGLLREGFVRVGLIPGDGGGWLLPRLIGEAKAKEYLLTGRDIDAETADELGLVTDVTNDAQAAAMDLAEELLGLPLNAVKGTNALIEANQPFEDYCKAAIDYQWVCVTDPEHHEAVTAFREGRDPEYDRTY